MHLLSDLCSSPEPSPLLSSSRVSLRDSPTKSMGVGDALWSERVEDSLGVAVHVIEADEKAQNADEEDANPLNVACRPDARGSLRKRRADWCCSPRGDSEPASTCPAAENPWVGDVVSFKGGVLEPFTRSLNNDGEKRAAEGAELMLPPTELTSPSWLKLLPGTLAKLLERRCKMLAPEVVPPLQLVVWLLKRGVIEVLVTDRDDENEDGRAFPFLYQAGGEGKSGSILVRQLSSTTFTPPSNPFVVCSS